MVNILTEMHSCMPKALVNNSRLFIIFRTPANFEFQCVWYNFGVGCRRISVIGYQWSIKLLTPRSSELLASEVLWLLLVLF